MINPSSTIEITAFSWVPAFAQRFVRDLRPRWACEEMGLDYSQRLIDAMQPRPASYYLEQPWGQVPVLKDAGITNFRFHDLRHCASTNLRRAGVDTATAMKIVGHKSEKMWKRYNSIEEKDLTQAAQKVHKYLQENTPGTLADVIGEERNGK